MAIMKHFKRIQYINYMIKNKATGDLKAFAVKNGIAKATLSEIIFEMKQMGFPIKYDRSRKTYFYEENGEMVSSLFVSYGKILNRENIKAISSIDSLCFSPGAIFERCKD